MRNQGIWLVLVLALAMGTAIGAIGSWWWSHEDPATPLIVRLPEVQPGAGLTGSLPGYADEPIQHSRQNAITRAAAHVGPAVVSISVMHTRMVRARSSADWFFSQFLVPRYYREQIKSMGSGVLVSPDGYLLTSEHVTHRADSIWVTLPDGRTLPASLIGSDHETDLAVLRVIADDLPIATLGNSDSLLIGEWAIALGNPFGYLLEDAKPTVTVGVISALDRDLRQGADNDRVYRKVIQTDAAINPGNSGGPLVNAAGQVIGINAFIFTSSKGSEGIAFAIPSNQARVIFNDLVNYGEVRPAWVGVRLKPLSVAYGSSTGNVRGVLVTGVQPGSPAESAGLRPGDVVRRAGTRTVSNIADWEGVASYWRAGSFVDIEYRRGQKTYTVTIELVERPLTVTRGTPLGRGLWVADISDRVASQLGISNQSGVVVTKIEIESSSESAGLQRGDVIRQVNGRTVQDLSDLERILKFRPKRNRLIFGLERDGRQYRAELSH